jgi:tripartite-type tricarboxylate transporter receptor subunit TctC
MNRRGFLRSAAAFGFAGAAFPALAQTYPARPVKLIVPFPAGGPLDIVARAVGDELAARLKRPFILENRAGAAGNLGTEAVARAVPDGHTLLIVLGTTLTANRWLYKSLPFDPVTDFRPLSILTRNSLMLAVHPSVPVNSVAELVAYAKKEPVSYGHAGHGSPGNLAMEYFRLKAGFQAGPVPYRGNAPLVTDLLGGQIKLTFANTAGLIQHVRDGRLKGLAVSALKRSDLAPTVPTVAEVGYPDFQVESYFVMLAPAAVPESVAVQLEQQVRVAMKSPGFADRFRAQDMVVVGSTGAEARARLKADAVLWRDVIQATNMQAS